MNRQPNNIPLVAPALFLLLHALPQESYANDLCPSNPADIPEGQRVNEPAKRPYLLCICGEKQPNGEYAIVDKGKAKNFLLLMNDDFLTRYDTNCNANLDGREKENYLKNQYTEVDKKFDKAIEDATQRANTRIDAWQQTVTNEGSIEQRTALKVLPDPPAKERKLTGGYGIAIDDAQDVENIKVGFSFLEEPWASPTTNSRLAWALSLDLGRKRVETDESRTVTRAADVFPLSFLVVPVEDLTLRLSGGLGYLITDSFDRETGLGDKRKDVAHVYKLGIEYQTKIQCLALGLEYKIRAENLFSNRLSYEWTPQVVFNFVKRCEQESPTSLMVAQEGGG